jgi:hypothetical protein
MGARRPPKAYELLDAYPEIALVRCPEGDEDTFWRLATEQLILQGCNLEVGVPAEPTGREWIDAAKQIVKPPVWRWFRINPDTTGEYSWMLGWVDGPGRGNFPGALVILKGGEY